MIRFFLYAICALGQFACGAATGGWSTGEGLTHYCFGLYIACDAVQAFIKARHA